MLNKADDALYHFFPKSAEKASDARNSDAGVLLVRQGAMTKQMMLYTRSLKEL